MEWLNYHHLYYFYMVAKEGSIARACQRLNLAQPTISGQLKQLEESLGEELLERSGRGLRLTEVGKLVYQYAEEIFTTGRELQDAIKGRPAGRPAKLTVGISDAVPKLVAYRILKPVLDPPGQIQVACLEDKPERLVAGLASHEIDLVLSDAPVGSVTRVRAFNHSLGRSPVAFFGTPALSKRYRGKFPESLDGAPFLLPMENAALRRTLDQWFELIHVRPHFVGEFQDSALMKTFGQAGAGVFAAPAAIAAEICSLYKVVCVATVHDLHEEFYAISVERRLKNPAEILICEKARYTLFGGPDGTPGKKLPN